MNSNWYYSETGEQSYGPIPIEDLGRILAAKNNSENFLVWSPGMSAWARAANIADLKQYFRQPTPLRISPSQTFETGPIQSGSSANLHPWRRYFARMIDLYLFVLIFFFFLGVAFPELFAANQPRENSRDYDFFYAFIGIAAYVVFETFCLNVFGQTLGKFLYGIQLRPKIGDRIEFTTALKRSLAVWVRGMGLGIPIIAFITLIVAYRTLTKERQTTWDRDFNLAVTHAELSIFRWLIIAIVWTLLLSVWVLLVAATK
jgi:uncharacterized RDD family membrane protein YckC